jgi:hypothetical protein
MHSLNRHTINTILCHGSLLGDLVGGSLTGRLGEGKITRLVVLNNLQLANYLLFYHPTPPHHNPSL